MYFAGRCHNETVAWEAIFLRNRSFEATKAFVVGDKVRLIHDSGTEAFGKADVIRIDEPRSKLTFADYLIDQVENTHVVVPDPKH